MRVLQTIRSVDPKGGGPIEGLNHQVRTLQDMGCIVDVASLDSPTEEWVLQCSLNLYALGPCWGRYGFSLKFVRWIRKNASRYDVIIVNGLWAFNSLGTAIGTVGTGVPYVVFTHGMLDPWFKKAYPLKHLKKWLYWPWADYQVVSGAAAVLFTCEEERRLARESFWLYKAREAVVGYGTSAPPVSNTSEMISFLEEFPELQGKRVVLFLSRIHEKKGCDLVLSAFAEVLREPEWHLVMAGPDTSGLRQTLENMAAQLGICDRITWTGMLSGGRKWCAYRTSEVFFLPSHQENFGVVVAEAMACAVPVLISNRVNICVEVEASGAGFVAADTLTGACQLLLQWRSLGEAERSAMRGRAVQCFNGQFEIQGAAVRLLRVLEEVTRSRERRAQ